MSKYSFLAEPLNMEKGHRGPLASEISVQLGIDPSDLAWDHRVSQWDEGSKPNIHAQGEEAPPFAGEQILLPSGLTMEMVETNLAADRAIRDGSQPN